MTHLFMRHRIANYETWRRVFDADAARRVQAGVQDVGVFREAEDPENVLVVQKIDADVATVQAMLAGMMADPDLAASFAEAGVLEAPEVWLS